MSALSSSTPEGPAHSSGQQGAALRSRKGSGTTSIRASLIRSSVTVIILFSFSLVTLIVFNARRTVFSLVESIIENDQKLVGQRLLGFYGTVVDHLQSLGTSVRSGHLEFSEEVLIPFAFESIADLEHAISLKARGSGQSTADDPRLKKRIVGLLFANRDGDFHMLRHQKEGLFESQEVRPAEWGSRSVWKDYDANRQVVGVREDQSTYDPRTRQWYQRASYLHNQRPTVVFSDPYPFYDTLQLGMTMSICVADKNGKNWVIGVDLSLEEMNHFAHNASPTNNGGVFLVIDGRHVVGGVGHDDGRESEARTLDDTPLVRAAEQASLLQQKEGNKQKNVFSFTHDGEYWWGSETKSNNGVSTFVLVPESDLMESAVSNRDLVIWLTVAALLLVIVIQFALAKSYSEPLSDLVEQSERITRLDLSPQPLVSSKLIEVNTLAQAQEQMRNALHSFSRYVPTEVVRELLSQGEAAQIGGESRELTVMFSDIRNFTTIAEQLGATALTQHMGEYFEAVCEVLLDQQATIDKFIGDAVMAFWGAPVKNLDHASNAVEAALTVQERLAELNPLWMQRGLPPLETRIGLATGSMVVGNVGSQSRLSYTVLGDTVNLSSRLEALNENYGTTIMASQVVVESVEGYEWRKLDQVAVKGKGVSVTVYELLGRQGELPPDLLQARDAYEEAFAFYCTKDFPNAIKLLQNLVSLYGKSKSIDLLLESCGQFSLQGTTTDWSPVRQWTRK